MRLPIVDNAERPVELDWLRIDRVVGAPVVRARLDVRRDPRERRRYVHATSRDQHDPADHGELDAMLAGELAAAVRVLVESGAGHGDEHLDADGLRHELEVSWGGVEYRYVIDGEPVDAALAGVLKIVTPLLDSEPRIVSVEPG